MKAASIIPVLALAGLIASAPPSRAQNPIIQTAFTPDPAPYVHGDTVYLFTDHDEDDAQYFKMKDWLLYSSADMVNWTFRGVPLSLSTFPWARQDDNAWAAQAVERNGKWYWYVCAEDTTVHLHGIGVAVADRPEGPYTDPLRRPLVPGNWGFIDPSVFIDDDGSAYLFWGNNGAWYAPLAPDMVSLAGEVKEVPGLNDPDAFGPLREKFDYQVNGMKMKTNYEEGPWVFKRKGIYYMVYAAGGVPEHMAYSTASNINGPWRYQGRIMDEAEESFTIHGGSIEFCGRNFMFYHNGILPNGGGFRRSTSVEEFSWTDDGRIPFIPFTRAGVVRPVRNLDPYSRVEAETMAQSYGLKTDRSAAAPHYVTKVDNGDWLRVRSVDFGDVAPKTFKACVFPLSASTIEVRLDNLNGTVLAELTVDSPVRDWQMFSAEMKQQATGVHDIYLLFRGGDDELLRMDWWVMVQ